MANCMPFFGMVCLGREMQGFLRIKRKRKGKCETYFTYFPLCGLLVPLYLEECHYRFYNLIGWRFVFNHPNRGRMSLGNTCWLGS